MLGFDVMLIKPKALQFACYKCDGPSFSVVGALTEDAEVVCGSCGAAFGEWQGFLSVLTIGRLFETSLDDGALSLSEGDRERCQC